MGMLVLDENRRFGTNAEPISELTREIRRDRNHPSIFMWSLENEEPLQGTATAASIVKVMQDVVHSMDPTRRCTAAMNGSWGSGVSTVIDVQGFNYFLQNMDRFHSRFPNQCCIGTEISSMPTDRGIYANDRAKGYVQAYDIHWPGSSSEPSEEWWPFYNSRPWASGAFSWTGFDYRGETWPYANWPNVVCHYGTLDLCGFPKDNFYSYQANWTFKPVLHLFPHWSWQTPGQPVNLWVFGNCQEVELFTNGVSVGRKPLQVQGHVEWDSVPFAPGTLRAVGYSFGVPVMTNTIVTAGEPAGIALTPDRSTILADGRDVSVITVDVRDAKGNFVPTASNEISFSIKGGTILGVGNGDPSCHEADKGSQRAVFNGLAQVIVQSTAKTGAITLTATSPGLRTATAPLTAASSLPPPAAPTGVCATGGNARVTVSWDIVPGATTYDLWRSTSHGGRYAAIAKSIGGVNLGYVDCSVANDTTYFYAVTANGNGASAKSAAVSASPKPQ
jgi:beta-galactosidase